ncbi:hypothetical protein CC80DRAFT_494460 [Byssothecium circinans]|uniref:Uncharacterized protein n=1 Tax=Byssothecium circinans TaxID=147558 RepID=A0A6A5TLF7_9PLEO|nr:hypothetical protein CC80DRAFT_494460 [Byssothecium circinans]
MVQQSASRDRVLRPSQPGERGSPSPAPSDHREMHQSSNRNERTRPSGPSPNIIANSNHHSGAADISGRGTTGISGTQVSNTSRATVAGNVTENAGPVVHLTINVVQPSARRRRRQVETGFDRLWNSAAVTAPPQPLLTNEAVIVTFMVLAVTMVIARRL